MKTEMRRVLLWDLVRFLNYSTTLRWSGTGDELRGLLEKVWADAHPELEGGFFPLHRRHSTLTVIYDFRDELLEFGWDAKVSRTTRCVSLVRRCAS